MHLLECWISKVSWVGVSVGMLPRKISLLPCFTSTTHLETAHPPPPVISRSGSGTAFCQFFSVCCAWLLLSGLDALSTLSCAQQQLCLCWSCTPNIHYFHSTGNFPAISDDLVNSYHLLLCCLDLLYSNALYTKNRQNLLNPNFEGNFYIFFENKNCFPWPQAGTKCKWVISD